MEQKQHWQKPDGTRIKVPIEDEIRSVLVKEKKQGNTLKVCIGTDSQVKGACTQFATVIVFLRKGKGGFMYVLPETTRRKLNIKERMLMEVAKSIEVAYSLSRRAAGSNGVYPWNGIRLPGQAACLRQLELRKQNGSIKWPVKWLEKENNGQSISSESDQREQRI